MVEHNILLKAKVGFEDLKLGLGGFLKILPSLLQLLEVGTLFLFSLKFHALFHAFEFLVDLF